MKAELGRGGRYRIDGAGREAETATGCTLYMDTLIGALGDVAPQRRVFVPHGSPAEAGRGLRAQGFVTLAGLAPVDDVVAEARRLGCGHVFKAGAATPVAS